MSVSQVAERSSAYELQAAVTPAFGMSFDVLATAPQGVAKLRELILSLAVRGKLVEQSANESPVTDLLHQINEAKSALVATRKIKASKPLRKIAFEDVWFDLPKSWVWVTLADLCSTLTDGDHLPPPKADDGVPFLVIGDVRSGRINLKAASRFVPRSYFEGLDWSRRPMSGDILYTTVGSYGIPVPLVVDQEFCFQRHIALFRPALGELQGYLTLALGSPFVFAQATAGATGIAQKTVPLSAMRNFKIPLPPLAEQARIVARVEELMHLCDALEANGRLQDEQHARLIATLFDALAASESADALAENWQRIAAHFDLLLDRPEAVDALEQTILQLAVRGLLVPQDPTDEPVGELLTRVRVEKSYLKSLRRSNTKRAVSDDVAPELDTLPSGWAWSSLSEIGLINPRNLVADEKMASFVPMRAISSNLMDSHDSESRSWSEIKSGFTHFAEGDVAVAKITPCFENGKSTIFRNLDNGIGAGTTELHVVRPLCGISPEYILLFFKSPKFLWEGEKMMTGTAGQKRLPKGYFENAPFPLPPISEQSRIVVRVKRLFRLCEGLRQHLQQARTVQSRLGEALVEAVERHDGAVL